VAGVAAASGDLGRAEIIARSITDSDDQGKALAEVADVVAASGDLGRAEAIARSITGRDWQETALADVVRMAVASGDLEQAEAIAHSIRDTHRQAEVLVRSICEIRWTPDAGRVHASAYYAWILEGLALFDALAAHSGEVIEVFPTA
jgi:hypothetical protein